MANEVLTALFEARETISAALQSAEQATSSFDRTITELGEEMVQTGMQTQGAEEQFDSFSRSLAETSTSTSNLNKSLKAADRAFLQLASGSEVTDQQIQDFTRSMSSANRSAAAADQGLSQLQRGLMQLGTAGLGGSEALDRMGDKVNKLTSSAAPANAMLSVLNQGMLAHYGAAQAAARGSDEAADQMDDASNSATRLAGQLSILNAIAGSSAFRFSSLSVNIGPFNLALRNILTQLPAILTGMSTMLALVASLAGAFITLGLVTGGLLAGGALAFFEDFSKQFEETGEAVEALMGALKDLFTEAMEPLMTEANMSLFINTIEGAARLVNRFAQFMNQMRDDVLGFIDDVDADLAGMFEAMHDSFVIMEPVLEGFIEFFLVDFPQIMVEFAVLTAEISGLLGDLLNSFGSLTHELLQLAKVVLAVFIPPLMFMLGVLTNVIAFFNELPGIVKFASIAFLGLSFALALVGYKIANTVNALLTLNKALMSNAAAGSVLGSTYQMLRKQITLYLAGNKSLRQALFATKIQLLNSLSAWAANTSAKLFNLSTTNALIVGLGRYMGILSAVTAGNITFAQAAKLAAWNTYNLAKAALITGATLIKNFVKSIALSVAAMGRFIGGLVLSAATMLMNASVAGILTAAQGAYATATTAASAATWSLVGALTAISLPISATAAAIIGLVAAIIAVAAAIYKLSGGTFLDPLINGVKRAIDWVKNLISHLNIIPGIGDLDAGVLDTDDIQSDSSVNLSFEESLEQNVDVQADPEDKAQLSRLTKDAIAEANSFARRQQGGQ